MTPDRAAPTPETYPCPECGRGYADHSAFNGFGSCEETRESILLHHLTAPAVAPVGQPWRVVTLADGSHNVCGGTDGKQFVCTTGHGETARADAYTIAQGASQVRRAEQRADEMAQAHAASFGALVEISLATDRGGEVDDYGDVVAAVERLSAALHAARAEIERLHMERDKARMEQRYG